MDFICPYCGEPADLDIDEGGGVSQRFIEDCSVCCRPFEVRVFETDDGEPVAELRRLDE